MFDPKLVLGFRSRVASEMPGIFSRDPGELAPPPQFWNLKFAPLRTDRDLAGVGRFRVAWGRDAEAETARETENLAVWGGESGRGPARVEKIPGCREARAAGFQNFSIPESGPSEIFGERLKSGLWFCP